MKMEKNKGITLIALAITIFVMAIIASIAIYEGKKSMDRANLENLKTNMLLIQGKAKEYVEEVNHRFGIKPEELTEEQKNSIRTEIYETKGKLQKASESEITFPSDSVNINQCYFVTSQALEVMGLDKISSEGNKKYYVEFDEENIKVEVYSATGVNGKYSLTDIDTIEL